MTFLPPLSSWLRKLPINIGNRTEWSPIWAVLKRVIKKSVDREAGVRFVNQEDYYERREILLPISQILHFPQVRF